MLAVRKDGTKRTAELTHASTLFSMVRQLTVSNITDQRTLSQNIGGRDPDRVGLLRQALSFAVQRRRRQYYDWVFAGKTS